MAPIVEIARVRKRFGTVPALQGVDLVAERGQVLALLGPNGAGKTTLVRMLATLLLPDAGTVRVCGFDVAQQAARVRRVIGLAGQHAAVDGALTGQENLELIARLFGLSRRDARTATAEVLERLGLRDVAGRRVASYSGGMRRRLDLGASLVGRPRLLLLDEPTTGLDPRSRRQLWDFIAELTDTGTDVLLTTQYLEEADWLADRIVILDRGRVVADGAPDELKASIGQEVVVVRMPDRHALAAVERAVRALGRDGAAADPDSLTVTWPTASGGDDAARVLRGLVDIGVPISELSVRRPSLDEVFLHLTGEGVSA